MSRKPIKKTDADKAWMQPRQSKTKRFAPEYHLIVSEGTDTEPNYFGAIKNIINITYRNRIQLEVVGTGDNTINLFKRAKELVDTSSYVYKHVWIVYDKDDFPAEHFDRVDEMCGENSNEETIYHAVWSNQCIELWFLLHFSFMQSDLHRNEYWPKLTECLKKIGKGKYEKNRNDMYEILLPYMDDAICNAKKLEEMNKGKSPSCSAPGTKVYTFVEYIKAYL